MAEMAIIITDLKWLKKIADFLKRFEYRVDRLPRVTSGQMGPAVSAFDIYKV